jgi:hypothetical protein
LRQVSITEAASLLGMTREGVRRRLLKGRLEGRKEQETGEWVVYVPDGVQQAPTAFRTRQLDADVVERGKQLAPTAVTLLQERLEATERERDGLREQVVELRVAMGRVEAALEAERKVAEDRIAARNALLDEMAKLLADARRPWWRRLVGA